eukprot:1060168-Pyramimonas_sp.AAC.1
MFYRSYWKLVSTYMQVWGGKRVFCVGLGLHVSLLASRLMRLPYYERWVRIMWVNTLDYLYWLR